MLCSVVDTVFAVGCPAFWIISATGAQAVKTTAKTINNVFMETSLRASDRRIQWRVCCFKLMKKTASFLRQLQCNKSELLFILGNNTRGRCCLRQIGQA